MKKIIVPTLALFLMLQGCNDNKKSTSKKDEITQHEVSGTKIDSELKEFAKNRKTTDGIIKKEVYSSASTATSRATSSSKSEEVFYQKVTLKSCPDGGTQSLDTDFDIENLSQSELIEMVTKGITISIKLDNCIEDGTKSNGEISMIMTEKDDRSTISITFTKDTTFEDIEKNEVVTIFKNSNFKDIELSETESKSIENMKLSQSSTKNYESSNLISYEKELSNGTSSYTESGEVKYNGTTYKVDEKYDGSKTPMVEDSNGDLLSGTEKYYNEKGEHITFKVVAKNRLKVSLDKDNDGVDDAEETLSL